MQVEMPDSKRKGIDCIIYNIVHVYAIVIAVQSVSRSPVKASANGKRKGIIIYCTFCYSNVINYSAISFL